MPKGKYPRSEQERRRIGSYWVGKKNAKCSETKKKLFSEGKLVIWNKGLKAGTDDRVRKYCLSEGSKRTQFKKGDVRSKGEKATHWKGGRWKHNSGYIFIGISNHPRAKANHGYVLEHILVMEKKIGRYLNKGECIHHMNHIKDDNRIENLMLLSGNSEHMKLHHKLRYNSDLPKKKVEVKEVNKEVKEQAEKDILEKAEEDEDLDEDLDEEDLEEGE